MDLQALRTRIGIVPQEPVIFSASALENIRYGRPDASDDEVKAAIRAAIRAARTRQNRIVGKTRRRRDSVPCSENV